MRTITRSVYGARLQSLQYFGLPYTHVNHTTLNEKFDIFADQRPEPGEMPRNRYYVLGKRGHRLAVGADGYSMTDELQHQPSDASLFDHMPFLLRRASEDLSPVDRAKYCLRKPLTHDGTNYIAYYGRRLDLSNIDTQMLNNVVTSGVTVTTPFAPSGANLNPTPPTVPTTGTIVTSGDYLSVSTMIDISMTQADIEEYINVAAILYGDERYAIISEIGLVAGVDKVLTAAGGLNYLEVVDAQITTFITDYHAVRYSTNGLTLTLDVGAVEPLLVASPGP